MNKFLQGAFISATGGFIAFLLVERFTRAREGGVFTRLGERIKLPEGSKTIFNATQTETIIK